MKKMLLTLTAAGLLAVPTGAVLARNAGETPTVPATTCQDQARTQDQLRLHEGDQVRTRDQEHAQQQLGDSDCTADGTSTQAQYRYREMSLVDHSASRR